MPDTPSIIALIPARAGSNRLPGKNVRKLNGHPLLAYSIVAAQESGIFKSVVVSTDSESYAAIARDYGAETPFLRPAAMAAGGSPDIDWVYYTLSRLRADGCLYDCFAILRPTSPFRRAATIRRAWSVFLAECDVDSLRAVERCREHPGKMWVVRAGKMLPLLPFEHSGRPWHSSPYQALPEVYVQNASLEIAWTRIVLAGRSIAGSVVMPFETVDYEGVDINVPADWSYVEYLLATGLVTLPEIQPVTTPDTRHD